MGSDFALLQDLVLGRRTVAEVGDGVTEACHQRLLRALSGSRKAKAADLTGLVRDVLRREEARQRGVAQEWWVPRGNEWPFEDQWADAGVQVRSRLEHRLRIRAAPWVPFWLPGAQASPPAGPLEAQESRRHFRAAEGDPFLAATGFDSYRCQAQKEMVRAALTAPAGATLVCNLPTGGGKSLIAHLPALLHSRKGGVTVVVVPTTALAMDQERSISPHIPHPTAYYSGSLEDGSDRREGIHERISSGDQRIVFTSPESAIGGLNRSLYEAADRGLLKFLVVDEAHIVSEWGGGFRSSFQELAGLRRDLLRNSSGAQFRTLLMTATLSRDGLRTLETLFSDPGPFSLTSAVQLRPEPAYWIAACDSEEQRESRVLEALRHLPRPMILYTTTRDSADRWYRLARDMGFSRCDKVTGATPSQVREKAIQRWRRAESDIMVATSAFGLGVDNADVRSVLHACIPESVDRFYQEVGRGGRDGRASISLVLHTSSDLRVARRLSRRILIGKKKGPQRWRRMFQSAETEQVGPGLFRVPTGISPGLSAERIDMVNLRNRAWNINTITLMARAGILQMDFQRSTAGEAEREACAEMDEKDAFQGYRLVRVLDPSHLDQATWVERVEPVREREYKSRRDDFRRMCKLLEGGRCVAETLKETYEIEFSRGRQVHVSLSCGGCPNCRARDVEPFAGVLPSPISPWPIVREMEAPLERYLRHTDTLSIFYTDLERIPVERFFRWMLSVGIRSVVLPPEFQDVLRKVIFEVCRGPTAPVVFTAPHFHARRAPRVPTLIFHPRGTPLPRHYVSRTAGCGIPRVLLVPNETIDPSAPHRRLRDVVPSKVTFSEFMIAQGL